jgi:hypothetical protein
VYSPVKGLNPAPIGVASNQRDLDGGEFRRVSIIHINAVAAEVMRILASAVTVYTQIAHLAGNRHP